MIYLHDTLIGWKYQKEAFASVPKTFGLGCFLELDIGTGYGFIEQAAKLGYPVIRAHAMWKDAHDFKVSDFKEIERRCKKLEAIAAKYPGTKFYLSGACEHRLNSKDAEYLGRIVTSATPHCTAVNVPLAQGAIVPGLINEIHGSNAKPRSTLTAWSSDGDAVVDLDITGIKKTFANAAYLALWEPRNNGRWESNDSTPRPKRRGWSDAKLLKSVSVLAQDKGATTLPKNWIYKSHSENKGNGDPRAEKPVIIAPVKANEIKVGGVSFKYYGVFEGNLHRYYASKWGFEISQQPVDVIVNGKVVGKVNASFRDNNYR